MARHDVFFMMFVIGLIVIGTVYADFSRCNCKGRCGSFKCDPSNTKGCDCVNCRCIPGSVGFHRCCAANCGVFSKTLCYTCKVWQGCNCKGCVG
ncbi:hypothetical protein SNE40_016718 [Patella caerulea]|uniref:Uncharacterized protein n=1 Tax=Patella caerulea TaxID=87958 RepID=A0AAN8JCF6_PATCE